MGTLPANFTSKVLKAYTNEHQYVDPLYQLGQCKMHMASGPSLIEIFIFATTPLAPGHLIASDALEPLSITLPNAFYYAGRPAKASPSAPPGKRGYEPDELKDPNEIMRITRLMCGG